MGLFSFNYSKPGPGVEKDAPKKKGIFLYFELFFRKFWKLLQANLLYFACSIPMLLIFFLFYWIFLMPYLSALIQEMVVGAATETMDEATLSATYLYMFGTVFSVIMTLLWGSGPASAPYAYIMRCVTREEHAWLWSDFKEKFKENFKQAIVVSLIDIVVLFLGTTAIRFYFIMYREHHAAIYLVLCSLVCVVSLIYTFMHYYIYQLMVTFENSLRQLYRNALILAVGFFPMNLILTAISAGVTLFVFTMLNPAFSLLLTAVIWLSAFRYPMEFYTARLIQRKLIPDANTKEGNDEE